MIEYQVINCLIFQPKHMLWVLKRNVTMRHFFQKSDYSLKKNCAQNCVYLDSDVHSMQVGYTSVNMLVELET